jgi:hypothetical protein
LPYKIDDKIQKLLTNTFPETLVLSCGGLAQVLSPNLSRALALLGSLTEPSFGLANAPEKYL